MNPFDFFTLHELARAWSIPQRFLREICGGFQRAPRGPFRVPRSFKGRIENMARTFSGMPPGNDPVAGFYILTRLHRRLSPDTIHRARCAVLDARYTPETRTIQRQAALWGVSPDSALEILRRTRHGRRELRRVKPAGPFTVPISLWTWRDIEYRILRARLWLDPEIIETCFTIAKQTYARHAGNSEGGFHDGRTS